ncbi:hypothetical protein [Runella zeae]|uniref:hypothetical protein n=1 Tax=Runella zeae TaxID=94255 RepID=UPI0004172C96|nr:hypothetical protein [Runella zeae]
MIADTILDFYIDYFQDLATVLYSHASTSPRFFLASKDMNYSEFTAALRRIVKGKHMILFVPDDEIQLSMDNPRGVIRGSFAIVDIFEQGNPSNIVKKQKECRNEVRAILMRMKRESNVCFPEANEPGSLFQNHIKNLSNSNGNATPVIDNIITGWECEFEWKFEENINFGTDAFA